MILRISGEQMGQWFVAGAVWNNDGKTLVNAAPIIRRHIKKRMTAQEFTDFCKRRGWKVERLDRVDAKP